MEKCFDNDNILLSLKLKAVIENYKKFYTKLEETLKGLKEETAYDIELCAEEIFANISFYAYPDSTGDFEVNIKRNSKEYIMEFIDEGIPYNPLEKPDPDITLPPEKRPIGGLGIFLVKQVSNAVDYKRIDGKNILTIVFNID